MVGGLSDDAVRMLETELADFGMVVLQTGGGGNRQPSGPTQYDQGSAVGVQLVRGDIFYWGALMAASTLTALPVIVFFLLVQRRIAFGLTSGAVRG